MYAASQNEISEHDGEVMLIYSCSLIILKANIFIRMILCYDWCSNNEIIEYGQSDFLIVQSNTQCAGSFTSVVVLVGQHVRNQIKVSVSHNNDWAQVMKTKNDRCTSDNSEESQDPVCGMQPMFFLLLFTLP